MKRETLITRREAIAMLGAGFLMAQQRAPRRPIIRTLLKDIESETLTGPILFHEHLSMHYPPQTPQHFTDDVGMMVDEAKAARQDGIACIVDGGHPDMSRSLDALKRIATESGLPVVASGGYYMQRTYPEDISKKSVDEIANDLVRDANGQHLGAFGEIGQQDGVMTADERKVFQAVGKAQTRTGFRSSRTMRIRVYARRRTRSRRTPPCGS
jgi:predicted metal-dependent phosphotriesterase family hydrolase